MLHLKLKIEFQVKKQFLTVAIAFILIINFYVSLNLNLFYCQFHISNVDFNKIIQFNGLFSTTKLGFQE